MKRGLPHESIGVKIQLLLFQVISVGIENDFPINY